MSKIKIEIILSEGRVPSHQDLSRAIPTAGQAAVINFEEKINNLSEEKKSWWDALLKNHRALGAPEDIPAFYQAFNTFYNQIRRMDLNLDKIPSIRYQRDFITTLSDMSLLLKKCPPQDRNQQLAWLHQIDLSHQDGMHFISPDMTHPLPDLDTLKTATNPKNIKAIVYGYLAKQPYHLRLVDYECYLDTVLSSSNLSGQLKCKMAYILAKGTSASTEVGFQRDTLPHDWQQFFDNFDKFEVLDRIRENQTYQVAFDFAVNRVGPETPRLYALDPMVQMDPMPPISLLYKLLKSSEYKFLNKSVGLMEMPAVQRKMLIQIQSVMSYYRQYPEAILNAVRFLKTTTTPKDENNQYIVTNPADIDLLDKLVTACDVLWTEPALLPLLTTFHLEYLDESALAGCITVYRIHTSVITSNVITAEKRPLFDYALSLFQSVKDRELPAPLTYITLTSVQQALVKGIEDGILNTRQDIRHWMHSQYADYFPPNWLLDLKDEVNITAKLVEYGISEFKRQNALTQILGYFNETDKDKELLNDLTNTLITLNQSLPEAESAQFYATCLDELKTDGLIARSRHPTTLGYAEQFKVLLEHLIKSKSSEAFEQFIEISKERVYQRSADGQNSLTKFNYLMGTLYPTLCAEGIESKEAFQFASELICSSPAQVSPRQEKSEADQHKSTLFQTLSTAVADFFNTIYPQPNDDSVSESESESLAQEVTFEEIVCELHRKKVTFIEKYPNLSTRINAFVNKALRVCPENPTANRDQFIQLIDHLMHLDDSNLVLSLMYHYTGAVVGRDLKNLSALFNGAEFQSLSPEIQKATIKALVTQLNNGIDCTADIQPLIQCLKTHQDNIFIMNLLQKSYQHAPFPRLAQFIDWTTRTEQEVVELYQQFDKNPCAVGNYSGREENNGFHRELARSKIKAITPSVESIFTQNYLNKIMLEQTRARGLATELLLQELQAIQQTPQQDHITLVLLTIELLHRSKGRTPEFVGNLPIPGRSFELNTTQIIAILAMLETGNKVTAEIGTGEGKSRIMMILNACLFFKGNTVDFITSNLALAERDYLDALPFYHSIGANVNFVTAHSALEDYQQGGINVSDAANMCLIRSKAQSHGKMAQVLNNDRQQRALLLDEADMTYFDVANRQYNYAAELPVFNIKLLPLYPLLMDFFAEEGKEQLAKDNPLRCQANFLSSVQDANPELFEQIQTSSAEQFVKWFNAATIAKHLQYNQDYTIVNDATISTPLGEKKVAAARCLINSRINEHAQFADHVHLCLHAELNRLIENKDEDPKTDNVYLKQALKTCQTLHRVFHLNPEPDINVSSSSNLMLNDYQDGSIFAVTGTLGVDIEKIEAKIDLGIEFLKIPKHNASRRVDRPTIVCENDDKHLEILVKHILTSRQHHQPILLMCKDDNESQALYEKLRLRLDGSLHTPDELTRIDAEQYREGNTPMARFLKENGGRPGQVIITTEILGRGIEYEIQGCAKERGLKVLLTYLPQTQRDYQQNIGRGGRYGQIGESQMILNIQRLKRDYGIDYLNRNLYANPEAYITRLQLFATYTRTLHRLFHKSFESLANQYKSEFEQLGLPVHSPHWVEFLKKIQLSEKEQQRIIFSELEQPSPQAIKILEALAQHEQQTQMDWADLLNKFDSQQPVADFKMTPPALLKQWFIALNDLQTNQLFISETIEVTVHDDYSEDFAGQAALFKTPHFIERFISNFRAWQRGEGLLFPNFYAWTTGHLSTRNYFSQWFILNLFIKPESEIRHVKTPIKSTYAALIKASSVPLPAVGAQDRSRTSSQDWFMNRQRATSRDNHSDDQTPRSGPGVS
jgi:hypothetical protein